MDFPTSNFTGLHPKDGAEGFDMSSKLEMFLKSRGIKPAQLARESGYSRQHLVRIRKGQIEPKRRGIQAIVAACRRLSNEHVGANDLFDLDGDD